MSKTRFLKELLKRVARFALFISGLAQLSSFYGSSWVLCCCFVGSGDNFLLSHEREALSECAFLFLSSSDIIAANPFVVINSRYALN